MRICLTVWAVMALSAAIAGCDPEPEPAKTNEAATPDLGEPGGPTHVHDAESQGKTTISTPPVSPDTATKDKAPPAETQPNAAPKESAADKKGDGKKAAIDDTIDDRDEEDQK